MKKKKVTNPLIRRIPRELIHDWRKYLVVSLFLILTIGFVSGMYVANGSMMKAAEEGITKYRLEDGHFELEKEADEALLSAIESGEKADVRQYYLDEAKEKLDEKFADEFEDAFQEEFDAKFGAEFDTAFIEQVKEMLTAQGFGAEEAEAALPSAVTQAKQSGDYQMAYDTAYEEAYSEAHDKAYEEAYDEAWQDIQQEVEEKYAEAEEKYQLNDSEFVPVPVTIYPNFYQNTEEDYNQDGEADGTIRIYARTEEVNLACLMEGRFPETEEEIAVDRMHADNVGMKVGDSITVGGKSFKVVGLLAYVNYATLHEKSTDLIFDALKFDVAMLTEEGFERLGNTIHYAYAWQYEKQPLDEKEEKKFSDDFLKALLTQVVTADGELADYVPGYANPAINFATDDMGSDEAMGGVLLDILIVIIAFIFAVAISNTITKEASVIGTLRASGYSRGELIRHYLFVPVLVTFFAAGVGNLLGYTVFKNVVVSMYYNSYSLPLYQTIWNPDAFLKTTGIPLILMFVVNLAVITKLMRRTPLEFLRHDLKKTKRKKAVRLPGWKFFRRFRLRIMLQNTSNYLILFAGIFFIMVMLAMAVGMPDTLDFYRDNVESMMFAKYQYVLKSYEDEEGNLIDTKNPDAEQFGMHSLQKRGGSLDEEISVYGVIDDSRYVQIADLPSLKEEEVYISASFADKYGLEKGSRFSLDEKYENRQYSFEVAGIYEECVSIALFMPMSNYRTMFALEDMEFNGYLSDSEITDVKEEHIATVITKRDITKMCDQLDHSMGAYMQYFQILCILLSAVMIYLLTKIIIEKNENAISMTKILGYENQEIASLYLLSTTIILLFADAVSVVLGSRVMALAWRKIMFDYSGWFRFVIEPAGYLKMFVFVLLGYLLVVAFDFKRIKKIPLEEALKNME
ncbi:MAG: ABC transporter permease [Blautia sp.]|nr:ABC transporter permease [Blautia sp.]MCM1220216.1 ABC transporter permease [Lachnospiraceae bacterium]